MQSIRGVPSGTKYSYSTNDLQNLDGASVKSSRSRKILVVNRSGERERERGRSSLPFSRSKPADSKPRKWRAAVISYARGRRLHPARYLLISPSELRKAFALTYHRTSTADPRGKCSKAESVGSNAMIRRSGATSQCSTLTICFHFDLVQRRLRIRSCYRDVKLLYHLFVTFSDIVYWIALCHYVWDLSRSESLSHKWKIAQEINGQRNFAIREFETLTRVELSFAYYVLYLFKCWSSVKFQFDIYP